MYTHVMRKTLIVISVIIAVLTALFFKDISNYFKSDTQETLTTGISTKPVITDGVLILLKVQAVEDENVNSTPLNPEAMMNMQLAIGQRINVIGDIVSEISIIGEDRIALKIAKIDLLEAKEYVKRLTTPGRLTIHEAHPLHNSRNIEALPLAKKVANKEEIVPTYISLPEYARDKSGITIQDKIRQYWLIKKRIAVNGADIKLAQASLIQPGTVEVTLSETGAKDMLNFTSNMIQGEFIITVLDGIVVSATSLNAPSLSKRFVITQQANQEASADLAAALMFPLENSIDLIEMKLISK